MRSLSSCIWVLLASAALVGCVQGSAPEIVAAVSSPTSVATATVAPAPTNVPAVTVGPGAVVPTSTNVPAVTVATATVAPAPTNVPAVTVEPGTVVPTSTNVPAVTVATATVAPAPTNVPAVTVGPGTVVPTSTNVPAVTVEPATVAPAPTNVPAVTVGPGTVVPTSTNVPAVTVEPGAVVPTSTNVPAVTVEPGTDQPEAAGGVSGDAAIDGDYSEPEDLPPSGYSGDVLAIRTERGLVLPVRAVTNAGYLVVTPCYDLASVTGGQAISGPLDVLIDPGHGGEETGAVGPNGLRESAVNLRVAELLRTELLQRGYTVELTRYSDERVSIQSRAELANAVGPRVFMSIHHNGGFPEQFPVAGTEVFVQLDDPESARLGGLVFEEIQHAFADVDADWMGIPNAFGVGWRQNGEGTDLYGVLRRTPDLASVLTEAMYISTAAEAELLARPEMLAREAEALATALDRWFDTDDPGSGFIDGLIFEGDLGTGGGTQGCVDPPLS